MTKKIIKKDVNKQTVFAVINLSDYEKDQKNVALYAAQVAEALEWELVLYPKNDETKLSFREGFLRTLEIAKTISHVTVMVSKKQINMFNFIRSLHDIAAQELAAMIIMQVDTKTAGFLGSAIWHTTRKTLIPTLLLPKELDGFIPYDIITVAVDFERKLQKLMMVKKIAEAFNSKINIFVENRHSPTEEYIIDRMLAHTENFLIEWKIPYAKTLARKTKHFIKHICKFASKRSQLLVLEVEPGNIPSEVEQNIKTLLTLVNPETPKNSTQAKAKAIPVLLTKTKETGRTSWR